MKIAHVMRRLSFDDWGVSHLLWADRATGMQSNNVMMMVLIVS